MRNKFFIFSLCLAMFFAVFSSSAFAASEYDNDVTLATYLRLGGPGPDGGEPCTQGTRDISLDWADVLLNEVDHSVSWYESDHYSSFVSAFEENVEAGSGWFVQQITTGFNGAGGLEVRVGIFEPNSEIYFDGSHLLAGFEYGRMLTMFIHPLSSDCRIRLEGVNYTNVEYFSRLEPKNLFLIASANIAYPTGYEGEEIPSVYTPPNPTYVAMGDSFSSGEGNPPFEAGTDEKGVNTCHRSPKAYPRLLQGDAYIDLGGPTAFVACSGATTASVLSSQMSDLSEETELVTITIGGNDIRFRDTAITCNKSPIVNDCEEALEESLEIAQSIKFEEDIENTISAIRKKAPEATILVVGYPYIFWYPNTPASYCGWFSRVMSPNEETLTAEIADQLNYVLSRESMLQPLEAEFVDVKDAFQMHEVCRSENYIQWANPVNEGYSYHPNEDGQKAYKETIEDYLNE